LTSFYNESSWTNASEMDTIVGEEPEPLSLVSIVVVGKVNVVECTARGTHHLPHTA